MNSQLENKVAVVTGGASGIGRACAQLFAARGARVVVADISEAGAEEAARELRDEGHDALAVGVDVTRRASVEDMVETTVTRFGGLQILVNSAGITRRVMPG